MAMARTEKAMVDNTETQGNGSAPREHNQAETIGNKSGCVNATPVDASKSSIDTLTRHGALPEAVTQVHNTANGKTALPGTAHADALAD